MTSMLYTNKIYGSTEIVRFESDSILKHTSIILLLMALGALFETKEYKNSDPSPSYYCCLPVSNRRLCGMDSQYPVKPYFRPKALPICLCRFAQRRLPIVGM